LFRRFRKYADKLYSLHEKYPGYQARRSNYLKKLLDIRDESQLLEDIKDVLDEIKMIRGVLYDQNMVVDKACERLGEQSFDGVRNTLSDLEYKFKVMKDHADSVEVAVRKGCNQYMQYHADSLAYTLVGP